MQINHVFADCKHSYSMGVGGSYHRIPHSRAAPWKQKVIRSSGSGDGGDDDVDALRECALSGCIVISA